MDAKVLQARIWAIRGYGYEKMTNNHARRAIRRMAGLGIFLRDNGDAIINYMMGEILVMKKWVPIGHEEYKDGNDYSFGEGKAHFVQAALGGRLQRLADIAAQGSYDSIIEDRDVKDLSIIRRMVGICRIKRAYDLKRLFTFREIVGRTSGDTSNPHLDFSRVFDLSRQNPYVFHDFVHYDIAEIWGMVKQRTRLNIRSKIISTRTGVGSLIWKRDLIGSLLERIWKSGSPILLSTDGSLCTSTTGSTTMVPSSELSDKGSCTAAVCLCMLDIRSGETIASGEWQNRPTKKLLTRSTTLPHFIGMHEADIGHAESLAFCLQEELLDSMIPRLVVMDSTAVRDRILAFRDAEITHRSRMREMLAGISKSLMERIEYHVKEWKRSKDCKSTGPRNDNIQRAEHQL